MSATAVDVGVIFTRSPNSKKFTSAYR